jgi:hypothetical protein
MYVIYKENQIPEIGGVQPQGIETGIAHYNGWYLAECPVEKLHDFEEFDFIVVSDDVANGLILLDHIVDEKIDEEYGDDEFKKMEISLSENDKRIIEEAKKFINNLENKIVTRVKIRSIKDKEDDLVDLKRLVHSLIDFVISDWNEKSEKEKSKYKIKELMEMLSKNDEIGFITTLNEDLDKLLKIVNDEKDIAKIVEETYLTKKMK